MFIPLLCLLSMVLAEPPVSDGYAPAHDESSDFQRSLSQEYGPPTSRSFGANSLSTEYGPPNARTAAPTVRNGQTYLPPNSRSRISQEYGTPHVKSQNTNSRGLSTEYGAPNARSQSALVRSNNQNGAARLSTEYGVPNTRSQTASTRGLSTEYGVPRSQKASSRSGLSQEYSISSVRNSPSQEYSIPSGLSEEYTVPSARATDSYSRPPSTQYGAPEFRTPSEEYGVPQRSFRAKTLSQKYGSPTSRSSAKSSQENLVSLARNSNSIDVFTTPRSIAKSFSSSSRSFSAPISRSSARNSDSYTQDFNGYSAEEVSDTYGVPNARDLSQEYGVPSSRADQTGAVVSSYAPAANSRSSPSQSYGAPSTRDSMPSDQYGVPEQNSPNNQGYSFKEALDELLNQEPANYDFAYKVNDFESGSDFGHKESRLHHRAEGSYFVVLPDGTRQVVDYEADEGGFKPRISLEPVDLARSNGYDENASDLERSADGPY